MNCAGWFVSSCLLAPLTLLAGCNVWDGEGDEYTNLNQEEASQRRQILIQQPVLRYPDRVQIGFTIPGRIESIGVEEGDWVKTGDALACLQTQSVLARLTLLKGKASAESAIRAAEAEAKTRALAHQAALRANQLLASTVPSDQLRLLELESERANAELAAKVEEKGIAGLEVDVAEVERESHVLLAPFDAFVVKRFGCKGSSTDANEPVLELVNRGKLRLEGFISPEEARRVRPGDDVAISHGASHFKGKLIFVDISLQQVRKVVRVWAHFEPTDELREGEEVSASIVPNERPSNG